MSDEVHDDHLVIIRIDGMHCHHCEQTVQKALLRHPGVHEVEVDFPTKQASVLFDQEQTRIDELMASINDAGYRATGFTQRQTDTTPKS
jgi:copper chaperone CopZ